MKTFVITFLFFILSPFASGLQAQTAYSFSVTISGAGTEAIIFIPGFACSSDVWNETKVQYEKDHTCYTLTMPGFAGVPAEENPGFEAWEKEIAAFISEKKIAKPVIVGHSMGGGLAMALAADYPELVSKIVVVDALPCLAALSNPSFQADPHNDCSPVVAQMSALNDEQFYQMQKSGIGRLMADTGKAEEVISWSVKSDRRTFATMYCDFLNTDLREKTGKIQCPALILLEAPFAAYKTGIEEQFKNLKTAQLRYATKGLHFIMFDDTEWYLTQLNQFIRN